MKRIIAFIFVLVFALSVCAPCFAAADNVQRLPEKAKELFAFSDETCEKLLKRLRSKSKALSCGLGVYATKLEDIDTSYYTVSTTENGQEVEDSGPHEKWYGQWITEDVMDFAIKGNAAVLFVMYDYNTYRIYTSGKGDELFTPEIKAYAEGYLNRMFLEHYDYEEVIRAYINLCVELNMNLEAGTTFEIPEAEHPARFSDYADLLYGYDEERAALIEKLNTISEKYEFDIVILTIKDLGYKGSWSYAHDFFVDNGYGLGEQHDGIMLFIAIGTGQEGERDWATYTSKGFSDALFNDDVLYDIEDDVLEYLRPSNWISAFNTFADRCEKVLADNAGKSSDDTSYIEKDADWDYYQAIFDEYDRTKNFVMPVRFLPHTDGIWLIIAPGLGLIISLIIVLVMKSKLKSVRFKGDAADYITAGSFKLTEQSDVFLYSTVTKTVRESSSSSGGGGGGGHSSGGGHSGKF